MESLLQSLNPASPKQLENRRRCNPFLHLLFTKSRCSRGRNGDTMRRMRPQTFRSARSMNKHKQWSKALTSARGTCSKDGGMKPNSYFLKKPWLHLQRQPRPLYHLFSQRTRRTSKLLLLLTLPQSHALHNAILRPGTRMLYNQCLLRNQTRSQSEKHFLQHISSPSLPHHLCRGERSHSAT